MSTEYAFWSEVKDKARQTDPRTVDEREAGQALAVERREAYIRGTKLAEIRKASGLTQADAGKDSRRSKLEGCLIDRAEPGLDRGVTVSIRPDGAVLVTDAGPRSLQVKVVRPPLRPGRSTLTCGVSIDRHRSRQMWAESFRAARAGNS